MGDDSLPGNAARQHRALARWLAGPLMIVMAAAAVFGWSVLVNEHVEGVAENTNHSGGILDYVAFHAAARLVREGEGDKIYDLEAISAVETESIGRPVTGEHVLPFLNPPFVALALAPIASLDLTTFAIVLFGLNIALFAVAATMLERLLGLRRVQQRLFFWLFCISVFPVFALFLQQQLTLWICLAWLGLVSFEPQGRHGLAGATLALALVKPQMVLLPVLFLVFQRRWRTLAWFSGCGGVLLLVSLTVVGPQGLIDYPRFLLDSTAWEANGVNARQMFGWNGIVADLTSDPSPPRLILLTLALPTLAFAAWHWRGAWSVQQGRIAGLMGLALLASLLANPHLYFYDITLANLALALGAVQSVRTKGTLGFWALLAVAFWFAQVPWPGASYNRGFPLLSLAIVGLLVVQWLSLREARGAEAAANPATSAHLAA